MNASSIYDHLKLLAQKLKELALPRQVARWSAAIFAALFVVAFVWLWMQLPDEIEGDTVANQWNQTISRLGIDPVYPPQEDIAVGDIFLVTSLGSDDDGRQLGGTALSRRSLKLWRVDLSKDLDNHYSSSFTFPRTKAIDSDEFWDHEPSDVSIFATSGERKSLPLVLFPELTVATVRSASTSVRWLPAGIMGMLGANGSGQREVEVKIRAAESYGVPYIVANAALSQFCAHRHFYIYCTQEGARAALSSLIGKAAFERVPDPEKPGTMKYRVEVEIMLVSNVYMTRWIETVYNEDSRYGMAGAFGRQLDDALRDLESSLQAAPGVEDAAADEANSEDARVVDALQRHRERLAAILPRTEEEQSLRVSAHRGDARRLAVSGPLPRPITIAFQSVRRTLVAPKPETGTGEELEE